MLNFKCIPFHRLTTDQLYAILKLRQEVFVVEQNCPYLDADGNDHDAYHVIGTDFNGEIQAYTRLAPPGLSYTEYSSIGRVLTSSKVRGKRLGKPLMQFSMDWCLRLWPFSPIKISAQTYIVKFYNELGFREVGEPYLEDDIPHIAMISTITKK